MSGFLEKVPGHVRQIPVKPFAQGKYGFITAPAQYDIVRTAADPKVLFGQIQNHGTAVLYVKYGEGASDTDFDICLPAVSGAKDGTSAIIQLPAGCAISVYAASGVPSYSFNDFIPAL